MVSTNLIRRKRPWHSIGLNWLIATALIILSAQLFAGEYQKFSSSQLLSIEEGKDAAKQNLRLALKNIKKGDYHLIEATKHLDSLSLYNPEYQPLHYKAGYTYVQLGDGANALKHLLQCDSLVSKSFFLTRGRAYHLNHQLDSALADYTQYKKGLKPSKLKKIENGLNRLIYQAQNGQRVIDTKIYLSFSDLPQNVNSIYNDYSPVVIKSKDLLLYTTKQPVTSGTKLKFKGEEILMASLKEENDSLDISVFSNALSTKYNEGIVATSPTESDVIVFRGNYGEGDFYSSTFEDGEWQRPVPFMPNQLKSKYKESSLAYIGSNKIVFSSERAKGFGGKDIYIIKKDGDKWSKPESLGQKINTEFDEKVCYYAPETQRLYISSDNPGALGGYDIFYVQFYADGSYGYPIQLGYPVNTANNEYDFYFAKDTTLAIISSDRPGTTGGLDLWAMTFLKEKPAEHFVLTGFVKEEGTQDLIPNASIDFRTIPGDSSIAIIASDSTGTYSNRFEKRGSYRAIISADGYNIAREIVTVSIKEENTLFTQDFTLTEKIVEDFSIDLMGIISNAKNDSPVKAAVSISQVSSDSVLFKFESDSATGKYFVTLPDKREGYMLKVSAEGFQPKSYIMAKSAEKTVWTEDIALTPIEEHVMLFSGIITDSKTGKGIPAELLLTNPITQNDTTIYADSTSGYYQFEQKERVGLVAEIKSKGYFTINALLKIPTNLDEWITYNNFELQPLKAGESIVLDNILFQSGKSIILKESYTTLDKIVTVLQENSTIKVEISGHTDSSGSLALNQRLSENRAKAVVDYLVKKGVPTERISSKGYGPSMPIETNKTKEGRAKNRRVEFKILED